MLDLVTRTYEKKDLNLIYLITGIRTGTQIKANIRNQLTKLTTYHANMVKNQVMISSKRM